LEEDAQKILPNSLFSNLNLALTAKEGETRGRGGETDKEKKKKIKGKEMQVLPERPKRI